MAYSAKCRRCGTEGEHTLIAHQRGTKVLCAGCDSFIWFTGNSEAAEGARRQAQAQESTA